MGVYFENIFWKYRTIQGCVVFKVTFNNISVLSWWVVLLVEETEVPGEKHCPVASHRQTLSHTCIIMLYQIHLILTT